MTRLAVETGVALLILGGGSPYLSGAGAAVFADNRPMETRQQELVDGWRRLIAAAQAARGGAAAPLLGYGAQSVFLEGPLRRQPPEPEGAWVAFWDDLDVAAIDLFLPGRPGYLDTPDTTPREPREFLRYMEREGLATRQAWGSLEEIGRFAQERGLTLDRRPVLLLGERVPAIPGGAAQGLPGGRLPRPGNPTDFEEQRRFLEARLVLVGSAVRRGLVGGLGLGPFPGPVSAEGLPSYGGQRKARRPGMAGGFDLRSDSFGLLDTPAEVTIARFWCVSGGDCL